MFVKVAQFESIHPGGLLLGDADLDGAPAAVGARIEARPFAPERHNATTDAVRGALSTSISAEGMRIVSGRPE